jgi:hypothetical protein
MKESRIVEIKKNTLYLNQIEVILNIILHHVLFCRYPGGHPHRHKLRSQKRSENQVVEGKGSGKNKKS